MKYSQSYLFDVHLNLSMWILYIMQPRLTYIISV